MSPNAYFPVIKGHARGATVRLAPVPTPKSCQDRGSNPSVCATARLSYHHLTCEKAESKFAVMPKCRPNWLKAR